MTWGTSKVSETLVYEGFIDQKICIPLINKTQKTIGIGFCSPSSSMFMDDLLSLSTAFKGDTSWTWWFSMIHIYPIKTCDIMWYIHSHVDTFDFQLQTTKPNQQVWAKKTDICQGSLCSLASACACPCGAPSSASSGVDAVPGWATSGAMAGLRRQGWVGGWGGPSEMFPIFLRSHFSSFFLVTLIQLHSASLVSGDFFFIQSS